MATANQISATLENHFEKFRESVKELQSSMDEKFKQVMKKFELFVDAREHDFNKASNSETLPPNLEQPKAVVDEDQGTNTAHKVFDERSTRGTMNRKVLISGFNQYGDCLCVQTYGDVTKKNFKLPKEKEETFEEVFVEFCNSKDQKSEISSKVEREKFSAEEFMEKRSKADREFDYIQGIPQFFFGNQDLIVCDLSHEVGGRLINIPKTEVFVLGRYEFPLVVIDEMESFALIFDPGGSIISTSSYFRLDHNSHVLNSLICMLIERGLVSCYSTVYSLSGLGLVSCSRINYSEMTDAKSSTIFFVQKLFDEISQWNHIAWKVVKTGYCGKSSVIVFDPGIEELHDNWFKAPNVLSLCSLDCFFPYTGYAQYGRARKAMVEFSCWSFDELSRWKFLGLVYGMRMECYSFSLLLSLSFFVPTNVYVQVQSISKGTHNNWNLVVASFQKIIENLVSNGEKSLFIVGILLKNKLEYIVVNCALKDMAVVMKQLNRSDEAIEAIKSFRHLCPSESLESLDNILVDLYKTSGRTEEQIGMLQAKPKHIEEGITFGGKRLKSARSQGKRIEITIEQEYAWLDCFSSPRSPSIKKGSQKKNSLVVCFGELLIDFMPTVSGVSFADAPGFKKALGGAPTNVAVGIAKLGGSSAFIGKVGEDEFGHILLSILCC